MFVQESNKIVNVGELTLTLLLAVGLTALAIYFGRRQFQTLATLRNAAPEDADERRYLRTQAHRRLFCSALMVVFAAMFVGWIFIDPFSREIQQQVLERKTANPDAEPTDNTAATDPPENTTPRRVSRFASIPLALARRLATLPSGMASCRAASLRVMPPRSHRMMTPR